MGVQEQQDTVPDGIEAVPALDVQRCETVPAPGGVALMRVSGRWNAPAPERVPALVVDDGRREHRLDALPGPGSAGDDDAPWGASYAVPVGVLRVPCAQFALDAGDGRRIELPSPVASAAAVEDHSQALVSRLQRERDQAWEELERAAAAAAERDRQIAGLVAALEEAERDRAEKGRTIAELVALRERLERGLRDLEQRRARELGDAAKTHERGMGDATREHERVLATTVKEHEAQLAALTRDRDAAIAALTKDRDSTVESLRKDHERTLSALRKEHEQTVSALRKEHERTVSALRKEHAAERAALEQRIADLERAHERERAEAGHAAARELAEERIAHQRALEEARRERERALADANRRIAEFDKEQARRERDLKHALQRADAEAMELRAEIERVRRAGREEVIRLQQKLDYAEARAADALRDDRQAIPASTPAARGELGELRGPRNPYAARTPPRARRFEEEPPVDSPLDQRIAKLLPNESILGLALVAIGVVVFLLLAAGTADLI